MGISLFMEGTSVIFLNGIGYKNASGQVKYDVKAGSKGIIKKAKLKDGKTVYDVELSYGKTLTSGSVVTDVPGEMLGKLQSDILKPVEEFPKKPKKDRPWRKFSTEQLEKFAEAHNIEWKRNESPKVNRMFLVKALDDSGVEAPKNEEELNSNIG